MFMLAQNSVAMGHFLSANFNNTNAAQAAAPLLTMPMILLGGLYANSGSYAPWFGWLQYLSPIRWTFEACATAQWKGEVL